MVNETRKENTAEKSNIRLEQCCFYVMDASGEYYLSNGCFAKPLRYC